MTTQTKLIIAAATVVIVGLAIATLISNHRLRNLENEVTRAKQHADELQTKSQIAEAKAGEYKQKIEYLEGELTAIGQIASRQDEQLKNYQR